MSEVPSKTKTWVVLVSLLGLSAVMAYLFTPAGEDSWGEPNSPDHLSEDAPEVRVSEIGPRRDGVEREPERQISVFEVPMADGDAGGVARLNLPAPGLVAPAPVDETPDEPEPHVPPPPPVALVEQTPERVHARAVFFRDLLSHRVEDTRAAAAAARAEGNPNRAARLERQAERLAGELPRANEVERDRAARVEAARAEVGEPPTADEAWDGEAVAPAEAAWEEEEEGVAAEVPVW